MFTIRKEQIAVFSEAKGRNFEERMVAHLNESFPKQCQAAGDAQVRETIQYGIKRAASHGILWELGVCEYIDLMVVCGRDFDRRLPWARAVLHDPMLKSPSSRVDRLYEEASIHFNDQA